MIELEGVELERYVFYKHAKLKLNHPGITTIYGLNKDAGKESTNSNGSGKTLVLSAIPDIRFETSSVPMEGSRTRAAKDSYSKGTKNILTWNNQGHSYSAVKHMAGASISYEFFRDGKPSKNRTGAYFKEKIATLLPWTETEYFNLIHIDSRRNSNLQLGSAAARLQFFTELFQLDDIDVVRGLIKKHLDKHKQGAAVAEELASQLASIDEQRKNWTVSLSALEQEYEAYVEQIDELRSSLKQAQENLHAAYETDRLREDLSVLQEQFPDLTPDNADEVHEAYLAEWKQLRAQLSAANKWYTYLDRLDEIKAINKKVLVELKPLLEAYELDLEQDLAEIVEPRLSKLRVQGKALQTELLDIQSMLKQRRVSEPKSNPHLERWWQENIGDEKYSVLVSEATEAWQEAKAEQARMQRTLKAFNEGLCDATECPTCTQSFPKTLRTQVVRDYSKGIDKCKARMSRIEGWLAEASEAEAYTKQQQDWDEYSALASKHEPRIKQKQTQLEEIQQQTDDITQVLGLYAKLQSKPAAPDVPNPEASYEKIEKACDRMQPKLKTLESFANAVQDKAVRKALLGKQSVSKLQAICTELSTELDECLNKLPQLKVELVKRQELKARWAELNQRLSEVSGNADDGKYLAILYEAYGNKGLKTLLAQKIAKHLENNMNRNRGLLFREDIKFEFIVSENEFNILAHRKYKTRTVSSDVRRLSGAESRAFNFLLPMSLIPLVPSNHRCNLMILDEPTVNMDQAFKQNFLHQFLPALAQVVPSIIFITPDNSEKIDGSRVIRAVKSNGITTLEEV